MIIHGVRFESNVIQGAGTGNFFGGAHPYWYYWPLRPLGLRHEGSVFTSKTALFPSWKGNMPLRNDGCTPSELFPKCIVINRKTRAVVNSVGLSGFGLPFYLKSGRWQARTVPFFISLALQGASLLRMLGETRQIVGLLLDEKKNFRTLFGIQLNWSCPNIGHVRMSRGDELGLLMAIIGIFAELDVPFMLKVGYDFPLEWMPILENVAAFDGWVAINTLKWDTLPAADRVKYFGSETSPLEARLGPGVKGGISGAPLLPYALDYIERMRKAGARKPIIAGGGALSASDAVRLMEAAGGDGNAVSVASVSMLAPTKMQRTILELNSRYPAGHGERIGTIRLNVAHT
ncbi:hypothetical protein KGQ31_01720, partial [Patescibacteria group bacterium]|nr:hypothetical protein [Patescibacteria group bacterium]